MRGAVHVRRNARMFSLISGFIQECTAKPEMRVLVVGLPGGGKTTFMEQVKYSFSRPQTQRSSMSLWSRGDSADGLRQLASSAGARSRPSSSSRERDEPSRPIHKVKEPTQTLGMNLTRVAIQGMDVTFWDVGGKMRHVWETYYDDTTVCIFLLDASSVATYTDAADALNSILLHPEFARSRTPVAIVANKSDLCVSTHQATSPAATATASVSVGGEDTVAGIRPHLESDAALIAAVTSDFVSMTLLDPPRSRASSVTSAGVTTGRAVGREYRVFAACARDSWGVREVISWAVAVGRADVSRAAGHDG